MSSPVLPCVARGADGGSCGGEIPRVAVCADGGLASSPTFDDALPGAAVRTRRRACLAVLAGAAVGASLSFSAVLAYATLSAVFNAVVVSGFVPSCGFASRAAFVVGWGRVGERSDNSHGICVS